MRWMWRKIRETLEKSAALKVLLGTFSTITSIISIILFVAQLLPDDIQLIIVCIVVVIINTVGVSVFSKRKLWGLLVTISVSSIGLTTLLLIWIFSTGPTPIDVEITDPQEGENVGLSYLVKGTVSDVNAQVYVFVHPLSTRKSWVQNAPIVSSDGSWQANCFLGTEVAERDERYEIIALATKDNFIVNFITGNVFRPGQTVEEFPKKTNKSNIVTVNRQSVVGIEFTFVPPYGGVGNIEGKVRGVEPSDYKVAVYIYIAGGWWTKPYWHSTLTRIRSDGSWECDITTCSNDEKATEIIAFLVPKDNSAALRKGEPDLPDALYKNSIKSVEIKRNPNGSPPPPGIEFTYTPPYRSSEKLRGKVSGVKEPADYKVAVYINVEGGWRTRPSEINPLTNISGDGNWKCYIRKGESEVEEIKAFLVPDGYDPPIKKGESAFSNEIYKDSLAYTDIRP